MPLEEPDLIDYVRTELGEGVWQVELTEEQVQRAISDAMRKYSRRLTALGYDSLYLGNSQNKFPISHEVGYGIFNVEFIAPDPKPSAIFYANLLDVAPLRVNRFSDYDVFLRWRKTFMRVTSVEPDWFYDDKDKILWIYNPLTEYSAGYFWYLPRTLAEVHLSHEDWVMEYTLARSKYILGVNRSKFKGAIPGPGKEITTDGEDLKSEAKEKMQELEASLLSMQHDAPPLFA